MLPIKKIQRRLMLQAFILLLALTGSCLLTACSSDDDSWKAELAALQAELSQMKDRLAVLENRAVVTGIRLTDEGYIADFSDGSSLTLLTASGNPVLVTATSDSLWEINGTPTSYPIEAGNGEAPHLAVGANGN